MSLSGGPGLSWSSHFPHTGPLLVQLHYAGPATQLAPIMNISPPPLPVGKSSTFEVIPHLGHFHNHLVTLWEHCPFVDQPLSIVNIWLESFANVLYDGSQIPCNKFLVPFSPLLLQATFHVLEACAYFLQNWIANTVRPDTLHLLMFHRCLFNSASIDTILYHDRPFKALATHFGTRCAAVWCNLVVEAQTQPSSLTWALLGNIAAYFGLAVSKDPLDSCLLFINMLLLKEKSADFEFVLLSPIILCFALGNNKPFHPVLPHIFSTHPLFPFLNNSVPISTEYHDWVNWTAYGAPCLKCKSLGVECGGLRYGPCKSYQSIGTSCCYSHPICWAGSTAPVVGDAVLTSSFADCSGGWQAYEQQINHIASLIPPVLRDVIPSSFKITTDHNSLSSSFYFD
ncbi:hypothetical protein C8J56DRAFT_1040058 [Mycena floridula]|nr:hypothetical protein C8J56DRAFT_1040058 [Mycena floridula]